VVTVPPLADRCDARRTAVISAGLVGLAGLGAIAAGGATLLAIGGIAVVGFGAGSLSPLVRSIPPDLEAVGARRTGTAMGLAFAVGELGGFSGPFVIGTLFDATGSYLAGLGLLAGGAIVVVGSGFALRDV
jgi:cyanate permease